MSTRKGRGRAEAAELARGKFSREAWTASTPNAPDELMTWASLLQFPDAPFVPEPVRVDLCADAIQLAMLLASSPPTATADVDQPLQLPLDTVPATGQEAPVQVLVAGSRVQVRQGGAVAGGDRADPDDRAVGGERVVAVVGAGGLQGHALTVASRPGRAAGPEVPTGRARQRGPARTRGLS